MEVGETCDQNKDDIWMEKKMAAETGKVTEVDCRRDEQATSKSNIKLDGSGKKESKM